MTEHLNNLPQAVPSSICWFNVSKRALQSRKTFSQDKPSRTEPSLQAGIAMISDSTRGKEMFLLTLLPEK
jgi:hypothetical protein